MERIKRHHTYKVNVLYVFATILLLLKYVIKILVLRENCVENNYYSVTVNIDISSI